MKTLFNKNHIRDVILILSFISLFTAFLSLACYGPRHPFKDNRILVESQAKSTLRAFGETELAYAYWNDEGWYGTWQSLVYSDYIGAGYTRGNIIQNYSLWTDVFNPGSIHSEYNRNYYNTFTAVAFPRITRPPGYLSTFAIREDQVLRVYRPTVGANAWGTGYDFGARTWEPVK
jgi:hypothetical protein